MIPRIKSVILMHAQLSLIHDNDSQTIQLPDAVLITHFRELSRKLS